MYPGAHSISSPDKPAVIMAGTGEVLTYADLESRSVKLARYFRSLGLRRGDHVALLSDNNPRIFETYWAAMRSGLYLTAINRHLTPAEVAYIIEDSQATGLVVSASLGALAGEIVASTPDVLHRFSFGGTVAGHVDLDEACADVTDDPLDDQPRGADMLYSSGTTGKPKGIAPSLPDRQVGDEGDTMVHMVRDLWRMDAQTVYLSPAPLYHAAPLRTAAAIQAIGGTAVIMDRFDAEAALGYIEQYRVTHSQWVPTMFVRMLRLPADVRSKYDHSSLVQAIHAAAPCPVDVKRAMIDWWGPILLEYYSSTELAGMTMIDSEEWLRKPGSVGRDGWIGTVHICGDDGSDLAAGEVGVIYFERETMPFEYFNDPAKTKSAQHPEHDNWATTGDVGYLDEDRYLFLTDRSTSLIISGGVNIYPQEIENVMTGHESVLDVAVIGIPDEEMGETVLAAVQTVDGVDGTSELSEELLRFTGERLARFKVPRSLVFVDSLPRTPTGKLVKRDLKTQLVG
ncbi:fatty-acyl-CoA synthase [Williamsia limnetica]|uniref:Fatty-acyl-CoA synthase n=1 Tax=Williamsia limnetica TaxID=882452 RepID=A0A318S647_WILLI|nr:acyl-CoA synthetase [Williamsia limnetica]PYE19911.1 fatty-acyl-CoA synthase [Williamsia limnetica]